MHRVGRLRMAQAEGVPLLGDSRTPIVIGAFGSRTGGSYYPHGSRRRITDRSRSSFRRHPAKDDAFQRTWVPFTVCDTAAVLPARTRIAEDCSKEVFALYGSASLSRRPHDSCFARVCFSSGHCKHLFAARFYLCSKEDRGMLAPFRISGTVSRLALTSQARRKSSGGKGLVRD